MASQVAFVLAGGPFRRRNLTDTAGFQVRKVPNTVVDSNERPAYGYD